MITFLSKIWDNKKIWKFPVHQQNLINIKICKDVSCYYNLPQTKQPKYIFSYFRDICSLTVKIMWDKITKDHFLC